MDRLINNPKFQAFDDNGDLLSGGKVYTYVAGTVTPLTTYSDRTLSTPNSNPVILDNRGEALIFCNALLKIVLKDSNDVPVTGGTVDNLRPTDLTVLTDDDGDTAVEVEQTPDEDKIRFKTAGIERLVIDATTLNATFAEINKASDLTVNGFFTTGNVNKMLFYLDTAPTGWSIDTTLDDKLVFVTKGSVAGGQTGGAAHSTGTWTQDDHLHTTGSHALTIAELAAHTHGRPTCVLGIQSGGGSSAGTVYGAGAFTSYQASRVGSSTGSGSAHDHGNTGDSATVNTWRPAAYNTTMCSLD